MLLVLLRTFGSVLDSIKSGIIVYAAYTHGLLRLLNESDVPIMLVPSV